MRLVGRDLLRVRRIVLIAAGGHTTARAVPRFRRLSLHRETERGVVLVTAKIFDDLTGRGFAAFRFAHGTGTDTAAPDCACCHLATHLQKETERKNAHDPDHGNADRNAIKVAFGN